MEIHTLTVDDVTKIHELLVAEFSSSNNPIFPPGIKNEDMLASAVSRQAVGFDSFSKYSTPIQSAATLTFGLCCNHPFHNGNKRAALVAAGAFDMISFGKSGKKGNNSFILGKAPDNTAKGKMLRAFFRFSASPLNTFQL